MPRRRSAWLIVYCGLVLARPQCRAGVDTMLCAGEWAPRPVSARWRAVTPDEARRVGEPDSRPGMTRSEFEAAVDTEARDPKFGGRAPPVPPCCSWDSHPSKPRRAEKGPSWDAACGTNRQNETLVYHGSEARFAEVGGHGCRCDVPERDATWLGPTRCELSAWDARGFCRLLGDRTLAVLGDSTFAQAATALMNTIQLGGGGCQHRVTFAQTLTLLGWLKGGADVHWLDHVRRLAPDIVVLGAGAHIHHERKFRELLNSFGNTSSLPGDVRALYRSRDRALPRVFWKTQAPGGCGPAAYEGDRASCNVNTTFDTSYERDRYLARDELAINHLLAHTRVGIVDMRMLHERADAHVGGDDCLHSCMRSAALYSTFPRMVMHELQVAE